MLQALLVTILLVAYLVAGSVVSTPVTASTVAELNTSNGSSVCPMYFTGPGVASTVWDNSTSTCTVTALANVGPTVCIASSPGGCVGNATDELVVGSGVTVLLQSQSSTQWAVLCVYSTLVNYGTIEGGSFCDYGTIINHGKMVIPKGNYFETLPYNGFGILDNLDGGEIVNDYNFVDAGTVFNNGTIDNHGQFGNDNQYNSNFTNQGTFVGSAPCFSYDGCITWLGTYNITSAGTVISQMNNGLVITITGASGTNVAVISQNQTKSAPMGLGSLNVSSAIFYDVMINGISAGTARICVANSRVAESMVGGMQYWDGTAWVFATNQTVSETTQTLSSSTNRTTTGPPPKILMLCGDIPVGALSGTPLGAGTPLLVNQQTTTTVKATSTSGQASSTTSLSTAQTSPPSDGSWLTPSLALYLGMTLLILVGIAVVLRRRGTTAP